MSKSVAHAETGISGGSPERFGYEMGTYSEIKLEYEEQFRRWTAQIRIEDWRGKAFLDVGCGMGRTTYWPMNHGGGRLC